MAVAKGEQLALVRTEHSLQSPLKPMEKKISFLSLDFGSRSKRPGGLENSLFCEVLVFFIFYFFISLLLLHLMFATSKHFFQAIHPVTGG